MRYDTIHNATKAWIQEMNAFPYGMIEKLVMNDLDEWCEVTTPSAGDRVYVYDLPDSLDTMEHAGEIISYDSETDLYCVELNDENLVSCEQDDFEVEHDSFLPMWGTLWQFGDSADDLWLEDGGIQLMSECGFRVYESEEFGYFFGIDGAGYDFYEAHWIPLYKARGLRWHKEEEE